MQGDDAADEPDATGTPRPAPELPGTEIAASPAARVLVIDDEPLVRQTIALMLRRDDYEVIECGTGLEALAAARAPGAVDTLTAVLLDWSMPGANGAELLGDLRAALPSRVPVVVMSGFPEAEIRARCPAGREPSGYLKKPFLAQAVRTLLRELIEP